MKKIKALVYIYKKSLISINYYRDLREVSTKFSIKYFLALAFVAILITSISNSFQSIPKAKQLADKIMNEAYNIYPSDLVINFTSAKWKINKQEPFSIPFPASMEYQSNEFKMPKNIVVFYHDGTINDLKTLDTLVLVNDANILTQDEKGKIEVYPLSNVPDGEITKDKIYSLLYSIQGIVDKLPIILFILMLVGATIYYYLYKLIYLASFAVILMLIGNIKKLNFNYGMYFRIGTHSITLPITLEVLLGLFGISIGLGIEFFIVHVLFATIVIINLSSQENTINRKESVPAQK